MRIGKLSVLKYLTIAYRHKTSSSKIINIYLSTFTAEQIMLLFHYYQPRDGLPDLKGSLLSEASSQAIAQGGSARSSCVHM